MIDERVPVLLRERLLQSDVDWRNAYFGPAGEPDRWHAHPPAAAAAAGVPAIVPRGLGLVHSPLEALRSRPAHAAELISELRMGEQFVLLDEAQGWWLVVGEDSYVGWARGWALVAATAAQLDGLQQRRCGRFALPLGALPPLRAPQGFVPLTLGVPLLRPELPPSPAQAVGDAGGTVVALVDGSLGVLPAAWVHRAEPTGRPLEAVAAAEMLLGCPYRWGGRSPAGLDCSGLVQLCLQWAGFGAPRDAAQQAAWGDGVALQPAAWQPGDLLCFGQPADHVGLWDGEALLHARGRVRRDRLDQIPDLVERLTTVRRPGPLQYILQPTLWAMPPQVPDA